MKKVSMFVWNFFTNDARVLKHCTTLAKEKYNVNLICIHDSFNKDLKYKESINGFQINRVKRYPKLYMKIYKRNKIKNILRFIKFLTFLKVFMAMIINGYKDNADIYHSNDLNTLIQGYLCAKFLRFKKRILIYDSHEVATSRTGYNTKVSLFVERFLIKRVDKVIMTTDMRADYLKDMYNIEKPEVIHNYPDYYEVDEIIGVNIHELLKIDSKTYILLYQGGVQEGRGIEILIDVAKYLDDSIILIIGSGAIKNMMIKQVEEENLGDKVRFIDALPYLDLKSYTKSCFLGFQVLQNICFNHYSTLSNKLFEYMMAEIPMIASDFPEIKKVVNENKVGLVVDTSISINIVNAINKLIKDQDLYIEMKKNCKEAKNTFCWDKEKEKLIKIYSIY